MTASVNGKRMEMVVPRPALFSTWIFPRTLSMLRRTTSMPTPRPDVAVTVSAVEKPGVKMTSRSSASDIECAGSPMPAARSRTLSTSMPPPSSMTFTTIVPRS